MSVLRTGLIGLGMMGRQHARVMRSVEGTELVAVEVGAFADGWVEVTGDLAEGDDVVVPA